MQKQQVPEEQLAGRVILITGACGGLGRVAALACVHAGGQVVLLDRHLPKLNRIYDELVTNGGLPLLYPLDMEGASPDDYAECAERVHSELGQLDGILHCAAEFDGLTPLQHTDPADFARVLHVGLTARWWLTQACLPLLSCGSDSAVVFVLDDLQRTSQAYWGSYGLAQHGLAAMITMLQGEQGSHGVRISGFLPGPMRTALRERAYITTEDMVACDPLLYGDACVNLFGSFGRAYRGKIWQPDV